MPHWATQLNGDATISPNPNKERISHCMTDNSFKQGHRLIYAPLRTRCHLHLLCCWRRRSHSNHREQEQHMDQSVTQEAIKVGGQH